MPWLYYYYYYYYYYYHYHYYYYYPCDQVGFGGWISTDLLNAGLTKSKSQAAYVVSIFWGAITAGWY